MPVTKLLEKWSGKLEEVIIGSTKSEGGTRSKSIKIGASNTLPFLHEEGIMPNRPVVAMEVLDTPPAEWPEALVTPLKDVLNNPASWAKKCEAEYGADIICLRLSGAHPENKNTPIPEVVKTVQSVKEATSLPLIIWGCGNAEKDNQIFPAISQILKGERCLMGPAIQDNYKTLAAICIADGHNIIAESPLDINISKQMNLLLLDMEFPTNRIVMYPTTGALGYGFEYAYSIMERTRLAALGGDKTMSYPILAVVGPETWKTKEAKAPESEKPEWGSVKERGVIWEASTATGFILAGADIAILYHPESVKLTKQYIDKMMQK
jgi:acetyl-CoA decarbonylase/synthase complex subunit delta